MQKKYRHGCHLIILYSWEHIDERNDASAPSPTMHLVGLCTGMLPAVAMAFSDSTSQLLELAPEVIRISLRLGLEASRRSAQIEKSHQSWATVVPGVPFQKQVEILSEFHEAHVCDSYLLLISEQKTKHFHRLYRSAKERTSVQNQIRRQQSVGHLLH